MSLGLDEFVYIGNTPWHGLGTSFETQPSSVQEIIDAGKFGWEVAATKMRTDEHDSVLNYHAIYRKDNNDVLAVVNNVKPILAQNVDMFNSVESLLKDQQIGIETAASLNGGKSVFGCFKISESYQVAGDDIDHYLVIMNDHSKVDGKITIMNTPVRVVCQNTLSAALHNNLMKFRIKCSSDSDLNAALAKQILHAAANAKSNLESRAQKMLSEKVSHDEILHILDELFPMIKSEGNSIHQKANENVEMARSKFIECLDADNLSNFRGTQYQVFNALTDFTQHYTKDAEFGVDLEKRMALLPGAGGESPSSLVSKYMKMIA